MFHFCALGDVEGGLITYSFLCPNGTIFNQQYFICDWWFNVDCSQAESLYGLNDEVAAEADAYVRQGGSLNEQMTTVKNQNIGQIEKNGLLNNSPGKKEKKRNFKPFKPFKQEYDGSLSSYGGR